MSEVDGIAPGAERGLRLLKATVVAANEAATVEQAAQACLDAVCAYCDWPVAHFYAPAEDGAGLVSSSVWHLDDPHRFDAFRRVTEGLLLPAGRGLPGRVFADGRPAWIADLAGDDNFPRMQTAAQEGLVTGFAFPAILGTEVVGVLEFFHIEPAEPDAALLDVMAEIGAQLGRVVERARAAADLVDSEERMRLVVETAGDAFVGMIETFESFAATLQEFHDRLDGLGRLENLYRDLNLAAKRDSVYEAIAAFEQEFLRARTLGYRSLHDDEGMTITEMGRLTGRSASVGDQDVPQVKLTPLVAPVWCSARLELMLIPSIDPRRVGEFVSHLRERVFEEAGIWETPCVSTVVLRDRTETHGPWPPAACSWVLQCWLDAGVIGLFRREPVGETHDLSAAEAKAALAAVDAWTPSIGLFLFPTGAGEAMPFIAWMGVVFRT